MTENYSDRTTTQFSTFSSDLYTLKGILHRLDGPAYVETYASGKLRYEAYYLNGKRHRLDGPAAIRYYESGKIHYVIYHVRDTAHRADGPSYIEYNESGKIMREQYYLNGKQVQVDEFIKLYESCEDKKQKSFVRTIIKKIFPYFKRKRK